MTDAETLAFYDREAATYAGWSRTAGVSRRMADLTEGLPEGAAILDLGCGGGWVALDLVARGFRVTAMDPSRSMIDRLEGKGLNLVCAGAEELDAVEAFDAIWSNCALQHLTRGAMPKALANIARALRPGGRLLLALHEGTEDWRDSLGRYYCPWTEAALRRMLTDLGLTVGAVSTSDDKGYDGRPITILKLTATRA